MENIKNIKEDVIEKIANGMEEIQNIENFDDIGLDEAINKCSEFLKGEINQEDFNKWLDKVFVLYYLPIRNKYETIQDFLFDKEYFQAISSYPNEIQVELGKWFYMMLAYTNIEVSGYEEYITLDNYDIMVRCLGNLFETLCGKDYNRLVKMYEDAISIENITNIMQMISDIPVENQDKVSEDINETLNKLNDNKETLNRLAEVIKFNNNIT